MTKSYFWYAKTTSWTSLMNQNLKKEKKIDSKIINKMKPHLLNAEVLLVG